MKETGVLASCSDYHIFKKLKMTRRQAMEQFLSIIKAALEIGVVPRVHLEDITRADFYGFVVPFAIELNKLSEESGIPIKIRACDTMGFGVSYPGVALPRSVPGIIYGLWHHAGIPSERLEWHGHNDFTGRWSTPERPGFTGVPRSTVLCWGSANGPGTARWRLWSLNMRACGGRWTG